MAAHPPFLPLESGLTQLQKPPRMQEMAAICLLSTQADSEQESIFLSPSSFKGIESAVGDGETMHRPATADGGGGRGPVTMQSHTQRCQSLSRTCGKHVNTQAKQP